VTNNTGEPLEFALSTTDFGSLDESGGVLFIGKQEKSLNYRYGLTSWMTLGQDRIVVDPNETEKVPITIENKESLSPGGHYGAILATPTNTGSDPKKVAINQVLTTLLFVKKQGGEVYRLGLQDIKVQSHLFTAPSGISLRFQNSGNVHVIPRGLITVTDPGGRVIKQGVINDGSAIILPQTFRQLSAPLNTTADAWMPGRYHLKVAYRYDGQASLQYKEMSFYYFNGWYLIVFILILAALIFIIVSSRARQAVSRTFAGLFSSAKKLVGKIKKSQP
jgi:hypothetical protein